jgi:hypothetical protein
MAKEAKPVENNEAMKKEYAGLSWDDQRKEDERRDRERLGKLKEKATPERISEVKTELSKMQLEFEAAVTKLREDYAAKKAQLQEEIGSDVNAPVVPSGPQPTNETLADGSPRRTLTIPVTA